MDVSGLEEEEVVAEERRESSPSSFPVWLKEEG